MSVHHLSAVADLSDTPSTCKLLLYGLAIAADYQGHQPVSGVNERMRPLTGLSERSIRGTLRTLERLGHIRIAAGWVSLTLPTGA